MKTAFATLGSMLLLQWATIVAAPPLSEPAGKAAKKSELSVLEKKLVGFWAGGACMGDYTFHADGTYSVKNFTPGNNNIGGTWSLDHDAAPPTLSMKCTISDFRKRGGDREEYEYFGKVLVVKIVQWESETLVCDHPGGYQLRLSRAEDEQDECQKTELAALQGTWVPVQYEESGGAVPGDFNFRQIIKGDRVFFMVKGALKAQGRVTVDATSRPAHLDFEFTSRQTDLMIYARVGDQLICCGNRNGAKRPSEFKSGTADGGEYLMAWKIEK